MSILKIEELEYSITTFTSYETSLTVDPLINLPEDKIYYFAKKIQSNIDLNSIDLLQEYQKIKQEYKNKFELIREDETVTYYDLNFETIYIQVFEQVCIFTIVFSE